jgi:hypothetical protein
MSKPRSIADFVPKLTENAFGKKSALLGKLMVHWDDIAGPVLAENVKPAELQHRTSKQKDGKKQQNVVLALYVRDGGTALEMQYQTMQLLEKINMFCGYNAVAELRFVQAPEAFLPQKPLEKARPPLPEEKKRQIHEMVEGAGIEDAELRAALERLGEGVFSQYRES